MLTLTRIPITRQRRVAQSLKDAFEDKAFVKSLEADVRASLVDVVGIGEGLDTGHLLAPLLVDNTADTVFAAFEALLEAIINGMSDRLIAPLPEARAKKKAAASVLVQRVFSQNKGYLSADMPLQYDAMCKVIDTLRKDPECAAAVRELGLGWFVDHLEDHLAPYGRCVKTKDNQDLEAVGAAFHKAFVRLQMKAGANHEDDPAILTRLGSAYETELEAHRADVRDTRKRAAEKKAEAHTP